MNTQHDPVCPISKGPCCPWMACDCACQCMCDFIAQVRNDMSRQFAARIREARRQAYRDGYNAAKGARAIGYELYGLPRANQHGDGENP